ncbi:MAG: DegV family protein [Thermoleophilaceae bacterium]|nr:DegV family protein [Thermoleophilaceae bacterium]
MPQVAIVTDTTANLPPEVIAERDVTVVPLYVIFGPDRTERESDITDYPAFFEELRGAQSLPSTSQPSIGDFMAAYEPLLAGGREVVSIHISTGLSGTCDSALQAAEQLTRDGKGGERVRVVDSSTVAGALGLVVLGACAAARAGATGQEVEARAHATRAELKMWFAVDTLEFFKRGGRIGAASAWIGSTLRIKPILTVENELVPVERVRTSSRVVERLVDYARQRHDSGADAWAMQHISADEQARRLADRCCEVFGREPEFVSEVGPVVGTHTGPGLLGVGSIPTRMLE